ncbi:hypothetical protein M8494_09815 [Serratia ureilytica]
MVYDSGGRRCSRSRNRQREANKYRCRGWHSSTRWTASARTFRVRASGDPNA